MRVSGSSLVLVLSNRGTLLLSVALFLAGVDHAYAGCNLIPGTANTFNATIGAANRPFAAPGERLELTRRSCDGVSLPAVDTGLVVTVIFRPLNGEQNAVVLTADGDCSAIDPQLAGCAAELSGGGTATCVAGTQAGVDIVERDAQRFLSFRFPDTRSTCNGGANLDKRCTQASDCPGASCVAGTEDETLAGPAVIAVTDADDPLPCALASTPCDAQSGLLACLDGFYANDGGCGTSVPLSSFPQFTALPPPNNYQTDCYSWNATTTPPGPCNPTSPNLRFAADSAGNLLLPVSWQGVLVPSRVPMPRLLRTRFLSPLPFSIPDAVFAGSFTPEGGKLPPIFEPQIDPNVSNPDVVSLFGSVDAPYTILRLGRRFGTCQGGGERRRARAASTRTARPAPARPPASARPPRPARPTPTAAATARVASSSTSLRCSTPARCCCRAPQITTPVVLAGMCQDDSATCMASCGPGDPCVNYAFEAELPVSLGSLAEKTSVLRGFTTSEAVAGEDLNGDGDLNDMTVTLRDRVTGVQEDLTALGTCAGVSEPVITQIYQPPFSYPAVAVENDVLAFLESELDQDLCIGNSDEDFVDPLLRIFRLGAGATNYGPHLRAVDAAPRINARPLVISNGRVFVRSVEAAIAKRFTERISVGPGGVAANGNADRPSLSADGRFVAFQSYANNLVGMGNDTNMRQDVFVRDRLTATNKLVSRATGASGAQGDFDSTNNQISADGQVVVFISDATTLLGPGGDTNGVSDVFVRDLSTDTTERVSVGPGGAQG